jgi:hypothetical protein
MLAYVGGCCVMSDVDFSHAVVSRSSPHEQRPGRWLAAALLLLLLLNSASVAHAQAPEQPRASAASEPTAAQRATARTWFSEGNELYAQKDYARALQRYEDAYRLVRTPRVGIEVAMTQAALGLWVEASATAIEVVRLPQPSNESSDDASARAEAQKLVRYLATRIPTLILSLAPPEARASVRIDDDEMPTPRTGALSYRLNPGSHRLTVVAHGYLTQVHGFDLQEGEEADLDITLVASPTALPALAIPSPAPEVTLPSAAAPPAAPAAPPVAADPDSAGRTRGYVALGVAGVSGAVGTVTGILAITRKPDCPGNSCRADQRDDADASERFGNIATVSFAVGIAAGAYGLWELLSSAPAPSDTRQAGVHITRSLVTARPGGASLELSGAF